MADRFQASAVNQKNVSMNANEALSEYAIIKQDIDEYQIASVEKEQEIEN